MQKYIFSLLVCLSSCVVAFSSHGNDNAWVAPISVYLNLNQPDEAFTQDPIVTQDDGDQLSETFSDSAFIARINTFDSNPDHIIDVSLDGVTWFQATHSGDQYLYDFGTLEAGDYILHMQVDGETQSNLAFIVNERILPPGTTVADRWAPDSVGVDQNFVFEWTPHPGATHYQVKIEDAGHPDQEITDITDPYYELSYPDDVVIVLRVSVCNAGGCGPYSGARIVSIHGDAPNVVTGITGPSVVALNDNFYLSWPPVSGGSSYKVYNGVTRIATVSTTNSQLSIAELGQANLKVQACKTNTLCAAPSEAFTLDVTEDGAPPPDSAPLKIAGSLMAPSRVDTNTNFELTWNPSLDATYYVVGLYDESTNPGTLIEEIATVNDPSATLSHDTSEFIFIRIKACNDVGCSDRSAVRIIELQIEGLGVVTALSSPYDVFINREFRASWKKDDNATSYTLQLIHHSNDTVLKEIEGIENTYADVTPDVQGQQRIRVKSCHAGGCAGWSYAKTINADIPPNSAPVAQDDFATIEEGVAANTFDVLVNDSDIDQDVYTITSYTQPTLGSVVCSATTCTFDSSTVDVATDTDTSFTYTIDDGNGGVATGTVTVTIQFSVVALTSVAPEDTKTFLTSQDVLATASAVNNTSAVTQIAVQIDEGQWQIDNAFPYEWNLGKLAAGSYTLSYQAKGAGVNVSGVVTRNITVVDMKSTTVIPGTPTAGHIYLTTQGVAVSATAIASISDFTVSDVEFELGNTWTPASSVNAGVYSHTFTGLAEGEHVVTYRAKDNLGNFSDEITRNITVVDMKSTTVTQVTPTDERTYLLSQSIDVSAAALANATDFTVEQVEFKLGDSDWKVVTQTVDGKYTEAFTVAEEGDYTLFIKAKGSDGLYSEEVLRTIHVVDSTSTSVTPVAPAESHIYLTTQGIAVSATAIASTSDFTVSDVEFELGNTWTPASSVNAGVYSHTFTGLAEGEHVVTYRAKDNLGNFSDEITRNITVVDMKSTTVTQVTPTDERTYLLSQSIDVSAAALANATDFTVEQVEFKLGDSDWKVVTQTVDGKYTEAFTVAEEGDYTLFVKAKGSDGLYSEEVLRTIHVVDSTSVSISPQTPNDNQVVHVTDSLTATAEAAGIVTGVTVSQVEFKLGNREWITAQLVNGSEYSHTFTNLTVGENYPLLYRAKGSDGDYSVEASRTISVVDKSVSISPQTPNDNQVVHVTDSLTATAEAAGIVTGVTVSQVEFKLGNREWITAQLVNGSEYSHTFTNLTVGE
ncbi:Ig-like domain-containing protein, partial [Paraglaciecola sp.]|uniref:Ig-like domain-containing protein n=1 Tax=Paraglaciecola sp. TaxID=1920173 RepID=UPI003EF87422